MVLQITSQHENRDALGTREVLSEEEEPQPNGKTFKKYVLGQYKWKTFKEFEEEAEACGTAMRKLDVKNGDRIAVLAETRADWIVTAYACFKNGITIVTIYTNLGKEGIRHAINETEVELLVCSHETMDKVKKILPDCPQLKKIIFLESLSPAQSAETAVADVRDRVRCIPFQGMVHSLHFFSK